MATLNAPQPHGSAPKAWHSFSDEERRAMEHDDSQTWGTVIPLLLFVICGGVLGMALTVLWVVGQ